MSTSLNDLLKTLQVEYLAELPGRIEGIEAHVSRKDIPALIEDFHKLKGTGKTYGIPEISALGEKMEQLFISCPAQGFSRVGHAVSLLRSIHGARTGGTEFAIDKDIRFQEMKKSA